MMDTYRYKYRPTDKGLEYLSEFQFILIPG